MRLPAGMTLGDLSSAGYMVNEDGQVERDPKHKEKKKKSPVAKALDYAGAVVEQVPAGGAELTGGVLYSAGDSANLLAKRLMLANTQGQFQPPEGQKGFSGWLKDRGRDTRKYAESFPDPGNDPLKIAAREAIASGLNYIPGVGRVAGPVLNAMAASGNNLMAQEESGRSDEKGTLERAPSYVSGALSGISAIGKTGEIRKHFSSAKKYDDMLNADLHEVLFGANRQEIRKDAKKYGPKKAKEIWEKKRAVELAKGGGKTASVVPSTAIGSVIDNKQKDFFTDYEKNSAALKEEERKRIAAIKKYAADLYMADK